MFSSVKSCKQASENSLQSAKEVLTSQSLQSLNMGQPFIYDDIDDSIKEYLQEFSFTKIHLFKSKLSGSISEKIIQDVCKCRFLNIGKDLFLAFRSIQFVGYLLSITIQQALIHHLEIILQGKRKNKDALFLLSYGSDGLQHSFKYFQNQNDRKEKLQKIYKRRKNNFHLKTYVAKQQIHGEKILEFMKDFFKNGQRNRYNLVFKNCQTFIDSLFRKIIGYSYDNSNQIKEKQQELNKMQIFCYYGKQISKFFSVYGAKEKKGSSKPQQNTI